MFFLIAIALLVGIWSYASFRFLHQIKNTPQHCLRPWFFVSSRKSSSDAILLGGLVINFGAIASIILATTLFGSGSSILISALPSLVIILIHGYLDDKLEISPRFKLFCQLTSVGLFTYFVVPQLGVDWWFSAPLLMISGFAVLNGANLLDGLDTMQLKLSALSLFFYSCVAVIFVHEVAFAAAILCLMPLLAFYPFNREPAKIHMGEIGANTVGLIFLALSTEIFSFLAPKTNLGHALAMASIPLALPVVELSTSFMRRLLAKKSPFRSDRQHIHHLLTDHYHFSAGGSATLIMLYFALVGIITLFLCPKHPRLAILCEYGLLYLGYWRIGIPIWMNNQIQNKVLYAAKMTHLKKRKLTVIDCSAIDHFQMTFYRKQKEIEKWEKAS